MTQELWTRVDEYVSKLMLPSDAVLDAALAAGDAAGLPAIHVAPNQGKFLSLLAQIQGSQRILEVGTLAGYSTIWWRGLSLATDAWSRSSWIRSMHRSRGRTSSARAWPRGSRSESGKRSILWLRLRARG